MTAYPKVAIITPVYNGATYLRQAIECVQAQTYPNLVHVILDNASTDATANIIEEYRGGARIPISPYRNDQTLPQVDNWNRAVELGKASTDYFRILCADDSMPPDSIQKMVGLASADPAIAVVGSLRQADDVVEDFGWDPSRQVFTGAEIIRGCFLDGKGLAPPHALYRTSAAAVRRRFFDGAILAFDTEAIFFLITRPGQKLGFIHEPLGITVRHSDSVTESEIQPFHRDYFEWLVLMNQYGRFGLNADEFTKCQKSFVRHYCRRLLAWRWLETNRKAFQWHMRSLADFGRKPQLTDYADAISDYVFCRLGLRERWNKYPQG